MDKVKKVLSSLALSELDRLRVECAVNEDLRKRFQEDPASVLAEIGVEIPNDVKINVIEDTEKSYTISLPPFLGTQLSENIELSTAQNLGGNTICLTCLATTPACIGTFVSFIAD